MAQQKAKNKHSEALDLIGYGLAKFAGPTLRKNAIASHISGSRNAFFRRLVEVGIINILWLLKSPYLMAMKSMDDFLSIGWNLANSEQT